MFEVTKNEAGKYELKIKAGAQEQFKGAHTEGFARLTQAINSDKVLTLNVSKAFTDEKGVSHDLAR
jgi:hypothetical protein